MADCSIDGFGAMDMTADETYTTNTNDFEYLDKPSSSAPVARSNQPADAQAGAGNRREAPHFLT
ncbi:hypothetical protein [Thiohalocapsa sp. ML1]|uniref:hypothetical protein n=1 Tax=Thiohalocapsa sp. ML1 TaxID=1431688 RepID=UPI00138F4C86|nr:hypothetical protein [Thiohalocapsa sp. ML1]